MEGSPGSGPRWGSNGHRAPQALDELQSRLLETLGVLSPRELRNFRAILKTVDEEPRVSQLQLELEGDSASGLAQLLAKHYYLPAAPRVVTKVLQQLRRADLLQRWESDPAADRAVIPRKCLKRSYDCMDGDLDCYDLSGERKAFLMCVTKNRPGAEQDIVLMEEWLGQCQFEQTSCIDPDKRELLGQITSFRDGLNEKKGEIGCCLVTLMSHGENGFIKMNNGERISLEDIFEMFNNKNCPALQEKPKIFIIQACRGEKRDTGVETDDEPLDFDDISEKKRLPTFSDYFIIYPTHPDHVALRHSRTGSVMIKAMADIFKKYGNKWHIVDFFTRVNNRVVHSDYHMREKTIKVSLVMESTLTKSVYF
ncbi:PREDICTED: caspase-14-like [Condylura cristata]|uniref:caspase-14-like n=1 Tax=Condylura cristata TaxID=143302 RepID=UPI0006435B87|nr:PREDICTED: caspase-14-like [Condylura cristata]